MRRGVLLVLVVALGLVGCGPTEAVIDPGDGGEYSVSLDPATFAPTIDNPWLPFVPGSRWVYEARFGDNVERIEIVVTEETREVMGITATVVRETESLNGEVVEDTFDWFAQDGEGNVWYLGEDTAEYRDGEVVSTAGAWEAGVDGALPGIIMEAAPTVGDAYRQEYLRGHAEDMGEVIRTGDTVSVPFGSYHGVLVTKEWTPLEPGVVEEKFYARGVGLLLEQTVEGGSARTELISYEPPS